MATMDTFKKSLLEEFGVNEAGGEPTTHKENYRKHDWTLRGMKYEDLELVNILISADRKEREKEGIDPTYMIDLRIQMIFVSIFLAAIDGVYTWQAFETATLENMGGNHPLDPPKDVKLRTAQKVYSFFRESRKHNVILRLFKVYNEVFGEPTESVATPKAADGPEPVTGDETDRPTRKP